MNLLLITSDDMNGDSVGWVGSKMGATPNLDAFARTCHRFINHHVTAPICQPSRSALLTGRVPHRNGALGFNPITPGTPTLPAVLKAHGYFTGVINKHEHMKPDSEFTWDVNLGGSGKNSLLLRQHVDELFKAAEAARKPFFINANITDPHRPLPRAAINPQRPRARRAAQRGEGAAPPRIYQPEEVTVPSFLEDIPPVRQEVAQYFTAVARSDQSFAEIMAALKAAGLEEKTIVVYLSDNGMSFPFSKATVYRNGTHLPLLLRWPNMGQPQVREELVSSVDFMPTVLELLQVPGPTGMDGRSWLPLLRGEKQPDRDYVITHVNTVSSGKSFPQRCLRTKDWSLIFQSWPDGTPQFRVEAMSGLSFNAMNAAAKTNPRIAERVQQLLVGLPLALYDLQADPDERHNLIQDPARREIVNQLAARLLAHMEKTNDPQTEKFKTALQQWRNDPK